MWCSYVPLWWMYYWTVHHSQIRAPNEALFAHLWCTRSRTKIHPVQVCPVRGIDPPNWLVGVCLLSKILHYASAWKSGNGFPLIRHRHHSCDHLSAQLYILCFQALWSSGSENYNIVRSHVHYTLHSRNPNTTFKIKFWVFTHGLWRAGSSEHWVIPS